MHSETDVDSSAIEETKRGRLSAFVAIGFFFALFLAIYPALSSMLAEKHPAAPLLLLVALPGVMSLILVPLFRRLDAPEG